MAAIDDLIADARGFSVDVLNNAAVAMGGAMNALMSLAGGLTTDVPEISVDVPLPLEIGPAPQYTGARFSLKDPAPTKPSISSVSGSINTAGEPPAPTGTFTFVPPPTPVETANTGLLEGVPSVASDIVVPSPPDLQGHLAIIPVPDITPIVIPPAPDWREPEFLGVQPTPLGDAPTGLDATMRQQYELASAMMRDAVTAEIDAFIDRQFPQHRTNLAAIEARLATYLAGGTAVDLAVEDALYNRALDKTDREARRATRAALKKAAQMGHTLYSPAIAGEIVDIDSERRNNNARTATEIAIKTFELEQLNLQFAVTSSIGLRKVAIDAGLAYYTGLISINGQALDYARSIVEYIVKAYEISARAAEVQVRMYEAEATIYRAKLEGSLAVLDAYKARVEGLKAQADVDVALVRVYEARINAVTAEANAYRAQIDGTQARVEIEKAKVDVYRARVQAYGEQVNADTARWQGYKALVEGQTAAAQVTSETYRAYAARVGGYEAVIRARIAAFEGAVRANEAKANVYRAEVDGYSAGVRAESEAVQAEIASYNATINGYTANAHAAAETSRAHIARYNVILTGLIETAKYYLEDLRGRAQVNTARAQGIAQVATAGASVYGRTAEAALSGMNTLAAQVSST